MQIPHWLYILLLISIPLSILFMIFNHFRIKKKVEIFKNETSKNVTNNNFVFGKEKNNSSLSENEIAFLLNTIIRNKYSKIKYVGEMTTFEIDSISNNVKIKSVKNNYDILIGFIDEININKIDDYYKNLNEKGMIIIFKTNQYKSNSKDIISNCKYNDWRFENVKTRDGIILIAKIL